ncbi:MAG TPA: hypothetical protein VEK57_09115 [Thermoanaerobaculia bacterium]|nr:hypothetical protein [Thermoanaerobaculia bacterium]
MCKRTAVSLLLLTLILTLTACASSSDSSASGRAGIQIVQTSGVPTVARNVQGPLQVAYAIRVSNLGSEAITLKRVALQSQSEGAYHISQALPFDVLIPAGAAEDVAFQGQAQTGMSLVGANGPVTLRVTAEFDSPTGKFREIATRVVNDRTSVTGEKE